VLCAIDATCVNNADTTFAVVGSGTVVRNAGGGGRMVVKGREGERVANDDEV